jgi:putative ABC transport system permease protein
MHTPPRLAERLLALVIRDPLERDMVLGDLHEQWIARRGSPTRASSWYCAQSFAIALHVVMRTSPEATPGVPGDSVIRNLLMEYRYAARSLLKRPAVTVVIVLTLALGLGANAAVFNIIDALVLRPFRLPDVESILMLAETGPGLQYRREAASPANFLDWRHRADTIQHLSALQWWDANLIANQEPERVQGFLVSSGFFDALQVRPALGRGFVHDDETRGRHRVVVLGDGLWRRRFGGDPAVVGQWVTLDGEPYQVVGIAPSRFDFPQGSELWAPLSFDPAAASRRDARYLTVIGHLASGRTTNDARAQLTLIAQQLAREYPDANRDHGVRLYTLTEGMIDEGLGPIVSLWQASAVFVLLIACANIANLLLARAAGRRREIAVRFALGAGRARVFREVLIESSLLALLAVPLALLFAWLSVHAIQVSMPARIIRFVTGWADLGLNARLVLFTASLALITAAIFGILPALQAARSGISEALKEGGRTSTGSRQRLRRTLVVAEMSLTLPLLVAAGLGVLGTNRFLNGPQGYDPDGVLTMKLVLPDRTYADAEASRQFVTRAVEAINAVPGVEQAAVVNHPPVSSSNATVQIEIDGHAPASPSDPPSVDWRVVTPEYFSVMSIPIREGRAFARSDTDTSAKVAIVSESMRRKFWGQEDPVGRRIKTHSGEWLTVVGICGDIIHDWFGGRNLPTMYQPFSQAPTNAFGVVVRAATDAAAMASPVRQALLRIDPVQPVFDLMTLRTALSEKTIGLQYLAAVMTVFATLALVLAVVGLYAVIAYMVAQRTHEIGVRIALGAAPQDVVRLTVGQALRLTLVGTAIGFGFSIALSRLMEAGMLGIASSDARVSLLFAAVLITSALLAGYLPARRAASIDPIIALRNE